MRVRIRKPFYYQKRATRYTPGDVVDVPKEDAEVWLKAGMAVQDKSLDGASEAKTTPKAPAVKPDVIPDGMYWCTKCKTLHRKSEKSRIGFAHLKYAE